ncbi:MAG: signal peptidase I [Isosphaeraceae bacterium]|nr:signal peptidase I [Isosphaeraceae bacterium]
MVVDDLGPERPAARRRRATRGFVLWPSALLAAWVVWWVASTATSLRAYSIPTGSMAPALKPGDRVGVMTQPRNGPRRGEIWIFRMPPASKLTGSDGAKRVIGLPGETIEVVGGRVLINGTPLAEPYLSGSMTYSIPPVTLAPGEYFVLGDSRNNSHDSHVWGPLPANHLVGPVKVRYWPIGRAGGF